MNNPIKLISQNFYKELSSSPVEWALANVGDKLRIETIFSVENYVQSTQDSPFILNNTSGVIGIGWIYSFELFTGFNVGDTILIFNKSDSTYLTGTITDKLDENNIQIGAGILSSINYSAVDYVISNTTPIKAVKYRYNWVENSSGDTFISEIDGSDQLIISVEKLASDTAPSNMFFTGNKSWQTGTATIKGVAIDDRS